MEGNPKWVMCELGKAENTLPGGTGSIRIASQPHNDGAWAGESCRFRPHQP